MLEQKLPGLGKLHSHLNFFLFSTFLLLEEFLIFVVCFVYLLLLWLGLTLNASLMDACVSCLS